MDRKLYKSYFTLDKFPEWRCPTCGKGILELKKDTFHFGELASSKQAHEHTDWEPDWNSYVYSCILECSHKSCKEMVVNCGTGSVVSETIDSDSGPYSVDYTECYKPKYFHPHLRLIELPSKTPVDVKTELEESFSLFFCNPASASNHVRIAVENIMTSLGIRRYETSKEKRVFLSLHKRIHLLPTKYQDFKDHFLAIKWLGNAGSHTQRITMDDVMDSYEIIGLVLNELFSNNHAHVKKLAKKINKKRGPQKRHPSVYDL